MAIVGLTNYTGLVQTVTKYLGVTDVNTLSNIPTFIGLAQKRITRELKILQIKVTTPWQGQGSLTLNNGLSIFQKPAGWISTITLSVAPSNNLTNISSLELRTKDFIDTYQNTKFTGLPLYFCEYDMANIKIAPFANQNYTFQLSYFGSPSDLSTTNETNIILTSLPDVLLYATLLESAVYLRDDERINAWKVYYDSSKAAVTEEDLMRIQNIIPNNH